MMQQPMIDQQSPVMSSPALNNHAQLSRPSSQMSDQAWAQNGYSYGYHQSTQPQQSYSPHSHHRNPQTPSVPYPYGQLPYQPVSPQAKPPHPLPGSYTRQAFNPQTRAFVPSSGFNASSAAYGSMPANNPMRGPMTGPSNGTSPSAYSKQAGNFQQVYQASSTTSQPHKSPSQQSSPQPSSLAKWGTPANLPPKPPPLEAPAMPDSLPTNPTSTQGHLHNQPISNYQNGVYGMPGSK